MTRVRILKADGTVKVVDLAWSQLCRLTDELTSEQFKAFVNKVAVDLPNGDNLKKMGS